MIPRRSPSAGGPASKTANSWAGAGGQFDVFLTVDRHLAFQQNLSTFRIAVVAIRAVSNDIDDLRPLVPELLLVLPTVTPGTITVVGA